MPAVKRLFWFLLILEILFCVIFIIDHTAGLHIFLHKWFNLDRENNVPTWFSSSQLLIVGLVFLSYRRWPEIHEFKNPAFLGIVGAGFIFLSMDEAASIHEKFRTPIKEFFNFEWSISSYWAIPYIVVAFILSIVGWRTLQDMRKHFPTETKLMIFAALTFVFSAVVLDTVAHYYWYGSGSNQLLQHIAVMIEEFLEMFSITIILCSVLSCAGKKHRLIREV